MLLAAYPARLRRKHGAELIATMAELAGPAGPTRAERARLVLDGLRERFRPPARRPFAVLAAILALLVGGALGAAAGSWLGATGYPALPDADALAQRVLPRVDLSGASDRYFHAAGRIPDGVGHREAAEEVRRRLADEGWRTGPVRTGDGALADVHFAAETDETRADIYAYPDANGERLVDISGWPRRPAAYLPLTVAGALLGLLAGWLAGVALAHRVQAARRPLRSVVLATTGLLLILPGAAGFVASLARYLVVADPLGTGEMVHVHGFAFGPTIDLMRALDLGEGWYLTPHDLAQLPLWGLGLIAVAAILARRRDPATEFAPAPDR